VVDDNLAEGDGGGIGTNGDLSVTWSMALRNVATGFFHAPHCRQFVMHL
jgi:hypothetical protein